MYYIDYDVYPEENLYGNDNDNSYYDNNDYNESKKYYVNVNNIFYNEKYTSDVFYNTDDPPKVGDKVFLVYAIYSVGDSYGIDDGKNFYPVCITKNKNYAEKIKKIVDKSDEGGVNVKRITIPLENGKKVIIDTPWNDYFGYLNYVEIEEFEIKKG